MVPLEGGHHSPAPTHRAQGESQARHMHRHTPSEAQTQGGWEGSQTDRRAPMRRQTDRSSRADLNARDQINSKGVRSPHAVHTQAPVSRPPRDDRSALLSKTPLSPLDPSTSFGGVSLSPLSPQPQTRHGIHGRYAAVKTQREPVAAIDLYPVERVSIG